MSRGPDIETLNRHVQESRQALDRAAGEMNAIQSLIGEATVEEHTLLQQLYLHEQVTALLTSIGEQAQQHAQQQVEGLVTRALQTIFDTSLSFHLIQEVKANAVQIEFVIRTALPDGTTVDTPVLEARGGGMAVVVAFVLRLVVLLLTPTAERILFLDESFAHLSREYEQRLAEFLREVADEAGVQIVLVTHSDAYTDLADTHYSVSQHGGVSSVQAG